MENKFKLYKLNTPYGLKGRKKINKVVKVKNEELLKKLNNQQLANLYENWSIHFQNIYCVIEKNTGDLAGYVRFSENQGNDDNLITGKSLHIDKIESFINYDTGKSYKNLGVATMLLNEIQSFAEENDYTSISLMSIRDEATKLYWKNGFLYYSDNFSYIDMKKMVNREIFALAALLYKANKNAFYKKTTVADEVENIIKNNDFIDLLQYSLFKEEYDPKTSYNVIKYLFKKQVNENKCVPKIINILQKNLNNREEKEEINFFEMAINFQNKACNTPEEEKFNKQMSVIFEGMSLLKREDEYLSEKNKAKLLKNYGNVDFNYFTKESFQSLVKEVPYYYGNLLRQANELFVKCFPQYEDLGDSLLELMDEDDDIFLLTDLNKNVNAVAFSHNKKILDPKSLYIEFICVDEKFHNKGYGSLMLQEIEEYAEHKGYNKVRLSSLDSANGVYWKNNYITVENGKKLFLSEMIKPTNKNYLEKAQITYEILREMKALKLKDVEKYVSTIIDAQEYDNFYQYGLDNDDIEKHLLSDDVMPIILTTLDDVITKKIPTNKICDYISKVKANNDKIKDSKLKDLLSAREKYDVEVPSLENIKVVFEIVDYLNTDAKCYEPKLNREKV